MGQDRKVWKSGDAAMTVLTDPVKKHVKERREDKRFERKLIYKQLLVSAYLAVLIFLRECYSDEITEYLQILLA